MRLALEVLEHVKKTYSIDAERVYVAGQSVGGFAAWNLVAEYPQLFAAAIPVCGGGDETKASRLVATPIWAFHGERDEAVSVERTRNMIEAIRKAGGHPRYTEYKGMDHVIWERVFSEPELLPWVFAQKRNAQPAR
jgi:predicted peptidase